MSAANSEDWEQVDPPPRRRAREDYDMAGPSAPMAGAIPPVDPNSRGSTDFLQLSRMVDLKGLLKLPQFTGRDEDFITFREDLMNVLAPMGLDDLVEYVSTMLVPPTFDQMSPDQRAKAKLLFVILHHVTQNAGRHAARAAGT